ncbi:peptidase M23 [Stenotrophomonas panacihumi]|uniref:Peptidase M23 n=1 Tax=Stenotrophomonas panacihumi TaxID=676599 RepID=A0A0R0A8T2_9GAMM|nr:peptidoglycan DD-metalloendopeptidase family protein [Stenotrophomonas panacihumi]KRG37719.1 peptidase M23 [Stenotrophomonas panacihumi]PTN56105.1 peptidase M23 [Stenotrophomonas panacihumi]
MGLCVACAAWPVLAQSQRETERKLQQMRQELRSIGQERRKLEGQRGEASRQLREADEKVARSARNLSQTETALREQQQALAELQARRAALQQNLARQRATLAVLLQAAYRIGDNAPLKLMLSQDSVADANRLLAYHRYVQRERAQQIQGLSRDLASLDEVEKQIEERRLALDQARQQQQVQSRSLGDERRKRAAMVADLDDQYQDRAEREKALGQDTKALEDLLRNLRAAAAKAEAERKEAARRAAAEAAAQAKAGGSRGTKTPPKVVANAPAPKVGGLGWPVSGNLLARYGGRLPDGRTSNGVLIGAPAGSTITAVADGTVVFSDWMTGYGMILIIDHGNGYMSLYAHNDTLLRDAGASVKRGEAVAKVGNSGGQGVPALYFELRRNGQPVDPGSWLQRR